MSKFSVKKPFTVLVMVVIILVLGIVSATRMQMDLLPEISLPYIMVITTYPGASPEKIETQICEPMEATLGKISGVKNVYSVSSENYGLVQLEFVADTDMDSAMVKVSSAMDSIEDFLPEEAGTPSIMEISMDMMATQYLAVAYDGMSIEEVSKFAENKIIPEFERQEGVASVSTIGLVEKSIQIELNPTKVDELNNKILAKADDAFADALEQLDDAKAKLEKSEVSLEKNIKKMKDSEQELVDARQKLEDGKKDLEDAQKELDDNKKKLSDGRRELADSKEKLEEGKSEYDNKKTEAEYTLAETERMLLTAKADLEAAKIHLQTEIAVLEQTNEAYKKGIEDSGIDPDELEGGIEQLKEGIEQIKELISGIKADKTEILTLETMLNSYYGMGITTIGMLKGYDSDTGDEIEGRLSDLGISVTGSSNLSDIVDSLNIQYDMKEATQSELEAQKAELEAQLSAANGGSSTISSAQTTIKTNEAMIAAYKEQLKTIDDNMEQVDDGLEQLYAGNIEAAVQLANAASQISMGEYQIASAEDALETGEKQIESAQEQIDDGWEQIKDSEKQLEDGKEQIADGWEQINDGKEQIDDGWENYYDSLETFEKQKVETLRHANSDELLSLSTLSQLIYAQNFEMPAGYIDDKDDNSWLLKVGEHFDNIDDISDMVLCNIDDIGDIRICDVAEVTVIDNSMDSYARLNNGEALILSIFKSSTAGTNKVSRTCKEVIDDLENKYDGLNILVVMDQGDYITIIIKGLLSSMIIGAILAIIILAIFLRDVKPTIVVAFSIPLSVLTALVALYFSGISLNMMSLSGLALGIGMLVDNSIVVLENIYRLRGRGVEAPRAAVQGARQVTGAIIASTLTTIAVFFPMVFTTGIVNDLMMPMALSIVFCLAASLFISMTLVPATCSTLLKNTKEKEHKLFEKIQNMYGTAMEFCLKHKFVPLLIAILLLAFSVVQVLRMGVVMIPDMTSNEMQMNLEMSDDMTREECYELADAAIDAVLRVDGIESLGVMCGGDASILMSSTDMDTNFRIYQFLIVLENENAGHDEVHGMMDDIETEMNKLNLTEKGCEYEVMSSVMDTSQMLGDGLSIDIYGPDLDELTSISEDFMSLVETIDGFTEISNGQETPDQVIQLTIDKNKAMSQGLSVAQIYKGISDKINDEETAVSVDINGEEMDIVVTTHIDPLTYENLMDFTFEVSENDDDGNTYTHDVALSELATEEFRDGVESINRSNQTRYITVSAGIEEGYNTTLQTRKLAPLIENYELPDGYTMEIGGEVETVNTMVNDMMLVLALGALLIYLVMVAQFQSLLSPFIVIFTVPLAFTGGLIGLWVAGENLSMMGLMGFLLLLGTVVNNGIVFVDYTNQLRIGGLDRHTALIATGKTRMRPILMTALTTILAMSAMIFGDDMGSQMGKGMAIVVAGGLLYATLMTLFIIPVMYDILYKKQPVNVDLGSENLDDVPDDAAEYVMNNSTEK